MAVADALVSKVLDMLVSTNTEEFRLLAGVDEEVQKLTSSLQSIQNVLVDAERRQWKEAETVQLWLSRLKHVAYDIDDVVDEWSYEILRPKTDKDEKARKPTRKVWSFNILSACYCFPRVVTRHHIAVKISDLNARLDVIAIEKDRYGFQSLRSSDEQVERNMTTSDIDVSEVKGREVDKEKLVSMLLVESSQRSKLRLISIVGLGGIGKTTLARLVYNDERVMSHFDKRIWVCVSNSFDETKIAKEILEYLQGATNLVSLDNIVENIRESIKGEKILLVLDDVWNEDPKKWKQLEDCLKGSLRGSSILVSTRNESLGGIMGCSESDVFRIELLSEEESWELFSMIAFSRKSSEERASLEKMGREVVGKCKGLPLAVKAIASLLQFKDRRMEWQSVLDSELWFLEKVHRDIVGPLWLSYDDLPSPLKQCLSYCAIFPKDSEMEKYELINHWIAQGYIKEIQEKDMETVGEEYFQNLVMRSFFQDVEVKKDIFGLITTQCKMHDIVHDFAQVLVNKECLSKEVSDFNDAICLDDSSSDSLRHLSIRFTSELGALDSFCSVKKLYSLLILTPLMNNNPSVELDLQKIFNEFTSLRSLKLHHCGIEEIPCNVNKLIHLRELDLSWNYKLTELPEAFWELYNLQILVLDGCDSLLSLNGVERLTNLRHLYYSRKEILLPKEIVRLSGLRRLKRVNIDIDNEEAFSLKHLKNFNQLGGSLEITWLKRGDRDVEDAKQAYLPDKKRINDLHLNFGEEETQRRRKQDEELVEALNVPPNLEFLTIENYLGLTTSNLLDSLTNVKMVDLVCWQNIGHLANNLGTLPFLENLNLYGFSRVRKVGTEFLGMGDMTSSTIVPLFPKLKSIKFGDFRVWEEWKGLDGDEEMSIMPSLSYLEIESCPKLKALPNFILKKTALKLHIEFCDALEQSESSKGDSE